MHLWHMTETLHLRDGFCVSMDTYIRDCTFTLPVILFPWLQVKWNTFQVPQWYFHAKISAGIGGVGDTSLSLQGLCTDLGGGWPSASTWKERHCSAGLNCTQDIPGDWYVEATACSAASVEKFPLACEACGLAFVKIVKIDPLTWCVRRNYGKKIYKYFDGWTNIILICRTVYTLKAIHFQQTRILTWIWQICYVS